MESLTETIRREDLRDKMLNGSKAKAALNKIAREAGIKIEIDSCTNGCIRFDVIKESGNMVSTQRAMIFNILGDIHGNVFSVMGDDKCRPLYQVLKEEYGD